MDFSFCAVLKFIWHIRCLFLFLHTWLKNNFWLFDNKSKQAHHFFPEWDFKLVSTLSLTEPQERALMIFQWGWLRAVFKTCLFTTFYRGLQTEQHSSASVKWGNNSWKIRVVPARIKQQRSLVQSPNPSCPVCNKEKLCSLTMATIKHCWAQSGEKCFSGDVETMKNAQQSC